MTLLQRLRSGDADGAKRAKSIRLSQ